ncbi:MAG: hypothetical protein ACRCX8_10200 [Sarcina sp.]
MLGLKDEFIQRVLGNALKVSVTSKVKLYDILKKDVDLYGDGVYPGLELIGRENTSTTKFTRTRLLAMSAFGANKEGFKFEAIDAIGTTRRVLEIVKDEEYLVELTTEHVDDYLYQTDIVLLDHLDGYGNKFKISITKNGGKR